MKLHWYWEKYIAMKKIKRNIQLQEQALREWKFYTAKIKEYKSDEITKKFVDYEDSIILRDEPGCPLMVLESNDSCKYFSVNAKLLNVVRGAGTY